MASRYHPIEDGLWDDPKLEGCSFEEHGFFAFLCSNHRQRPSGIYRATDGQLAADTGLPVKRVTSYLADLHSRGPIVRDGAWIFTKKYFKRQRKGPWLLVGAETDVKSCISLPILEAFAECYPIYKHWVPTESELSTPNLSAQSRAVTEQLQSRADEDGSDRPAEPSAALDPTLSAILADCPHLALVSNGESGPFWDQILGACEPYPMANAAWLGLKLRQWDTWFKNHTSRRSRKREFLESRLMEWLGKDLEELARKR